MKNWKKYEMYKDKIRTGLLHVNESVYKKAVSLSVAGIIAVTTISGCSLSKISKNELIESNIEEIYFNDLDTEIEAKFNFIDDFLNEIRTDQLITIEQFRNIVFTPYKKAKSIEYDLDPKNNEYVMFYTEEDIKNKKQHIISNLNESIQIIEKYSNRCFAEEYNRINTK